MAEGSVVWVDVLPSMRNFGAELAKQAAGSGMRAGRQVGAELEKAATDAGRRAGQSMGAGLEAAQARADKLAQALQAARNREADAAGKVRVAEERLAEVRANANSKASQIAAAEERLAATQRGLSTASDRAAAAARQFEQAQANAADAVDSASLSLDQAETATGGFGSSLGSLAKTAGGFASGVLAIGGAADTAAQMLENAQLGDKLAAQLGATPQMSADLGHIAGSLYAQAYGDSMGQVNDAIRGVIQSGLVMEDASNAQIESITAKVLNLASAFDLDLGEATQAVGQLLKTGLAPDAEAALDIVTRGFQQGADRSGDFLDTLTEYSVQFQKFGLDAQTATGLLVQGMQEGARNSDLVADAIKEFSIRAVDGSTTTADGFKAIGLSADDMAAKIARGGPEATAALNLVMDRLRAMKDPVAQSQAAVALFGTQAEDLGSALYALDPSKAVGALGDIGGAADAMGATLRDNAQTRLTEFGRSLQTGIIDFLGGKVIPAFQGFVGWIQDNSGWLAPLVIGLGSFAATMALVNGAMTLWAARTAIVTGAQWALNAAMSANPLGLVIAAVVALGAVLVYAWNNSETFRNIVVGAWNGIAAAAQWAWSNVLKPVVDALAAAATWLWFTVLSPVFGWLEAGWRLAVTGMKWAYDNVLAPVWRAVQAAAQWLWFTVLKPVFDGIGAGWRLVLDGMGWAYEHVLRPVFDAASRAVDAVGQTFDRTASWIRDAWDKIKEYARAPIQFVVDVVYNNGIRKVWNGIAGVFGLGKLDEVRLSGGGVLPGYAPGRDTVPAMLFPGEAVLTPEATRFLGPANILALNRQLSGRPPGAVPAGGGRAHFAGGGIVDGLAAAVSWIPGIGGAVRVLRDLFNGGGLGAGMWRDLVTAIPRKAIEAISSWFTSPSGYGQTPVANVGAGVQRWTPVVLQALAMLGQPASLLATTLRRMQQESGGNPHAINLWDSNAKHGTPSIGLMQVIGPTFARYRDPRAANSIYDPLANILASMRYALARYGSLPVAYNRPGGYDSGGYLPPGGSLVYNHTGKPEPVFTAEQWDTLRRYLPTEGGGRPIEIHVHPRADQSETSIATAVRRELALNLRTR
ncbi:phage tail tape measure protein [Saccharopolyspora rosea]|uniref:phage tail tape measure protein n=1 Tax=Saccharopolyspora rosea TaxID=524884 RepID=UPI0021D7EEDF|nr:phage tail tape measure protein [Saccharopolyspora rosea]